MEFCKSLGLNINSYDREGNPSSSSSNYKIRLKNAIDNVNSVVLREVVFPNTLYNVTNSNNYIEFNDGTNTYSMSISPGAYDAITLAAAIQAGMNSLSTGFTVTYNSNTFRMEFSNATTSFTLLFGTGLNSSVNMSLLLGFNKIDYTSSGSGPYIIKGVRIVKLSLPYNLYITVNEFGTRSRTTSGYQYTFKMTMKTNSSGLTYLDNITDYNQVYSFGPRNSFNSLTVAIKDDLGREIDLNGADWSMYVQFFYN